MIDTRPRHAPETKPRPGTHKTSFKKLVERSGPVPVLNGKFGAGGENFVGNNLEKL